jgi:hypothetical protein
MNVTYSTDYVAISVVISFLLGGIIGFGLPWRVSAIKEDAIKAGVAEYYIDQKNQKSFRWKGVNP